MKIAIIGACGKMGRWLTKFLLNDSKQVILADINETELSSIKEQSGIEKVSTIDAVNNADVIILAVPINKFENVVEEISSYIRPEQLIFDITSVKATSIDVMHRYIKQGTVLGTHPMFGHGATSIDGQNVILTPTSNTEEVLAQKVKKYLENKGARVICMNPSEHDEIMSIVLGLSHFIALVAGDTLLSLEKNKDAELVSGTTYRMLISLIKNVVSEDPEFYALLQMNLPGLTAIEEQFCSKVADWANLIKKGDIQEFTQKMSYLKGQFL